MSSISIFDPDVDAEALHTRVADLAVPCSSYTNSAQILEIARRENASMVHPGYGFLSEDAGFAQQCGDSGITFVGPSPAAVALFGDKTRARQLAMDCGVPVLPGSMEAFADLPSLKAYLAAEAAAGRPLAYPLLLKAVNGGGGRGQRLVREPAELAGALDRCLSEARAFGGDGGVFVESFLESASHIEVQVLGDQGGALVHLFERDCSVQRGNQKVVEIAPAIHMHPELRRQLCEAALKIAAKAGYSNAGTVEFLTWCPIYVDGPGGNDLDRLLELGVTEGDLIFHYIWITEYLWKHICPDDRGQCFTINNMEGLGISTFQGKKKRAILRIMKLMEAHYPERSFKIFIVNGPWWFTNMAWPIVKRLANKQTLDKIKNFSKPNESFRAEISKHVDTARLPKKFMGTCDLALIDSPQETAMRKLAYGICKEKGVEMERHPTEHDRVARTVDGPLD
eukprot:g6408.t1